MLFLGHWRFLCVAFTVLVAPSHQIYSIFSCFLLLEVFLIKCCCSVVLHVFKTLAHPKVKNCQDVNDKTHANKWCHWSQTWCGAFRATLLKDYRTFSFSVFSLHKALEASEYREVSPYSLSLYGKQQLEHSVKHILCSTHKINSNRFGM